MLSSELSRRDFVLTAATAVLPARIVGGRQATITAQEVVARIRANGGASPQNSTVDAFKAGDPAAVVTGIATTVMATLDVLRTAAAKKLNLVITQEPTFYAPNDMPGARATDPVYLAKKAFLDAERLIVWRFADGWNARRPNPSALALSKALGWNGGLLAEGDVVCPIPQTTFGALVADVRKKLGVRGGSRTVGRPDMPVRSVYISPGTTDVPGTIRNLARADVILSGEPREWEAVPYTLDTASAGQPKGMIALGRLVSEGPGMLACADWLKTFIREVPVEPIAVADPYWSPTL